MMKTAIMAITLLIGGIAFGQEKTASPYEKAAQLTEKITKQLELNADQSSKIAHINVGIALKNHGIRENTSFTAEQKKDIIQSNYEAAKSMYQGVLSADQYTKFIAAEKERMAKKETDKKVKKDAELDDL